MTRTCPGRHQVHTQRPTFLSDGQQLLQRSRQSIQLPPHDHIEFPSPHIAQHCVQRRSIVLPSTLSLVPIKQHTPSLESRHNGATPFPACRCPAHWSRLSDTSLLFFPSWLFTLYASAWPTAPLQRYTPKVQTSDVVTSTLHELAVHATV